MTTENKHEIAAQLQDAFHFAAYAAGAFGRSLFSDRDIKNASPESRAFFRREPTERQLAVTALLRAGQCAVQAGTPAVAVGTASKWPLAKVRKVAADLLAAIEAFAAQHGIDAAQGRVIETGVTGAPAGDGSDLDEQVKISNEIVDEIIAEERAESALPATKKIPTETVNATHVVVSKSGMQLQVHTLAGMPGDRIILGKRLDEAAKGQNEAWPVLDLEMVRVLAK